jgi:hypothetical protein
MNKGPANKDVIDQANLQLAEVSAELYSEEVDVLYEELIEDAIHWIQDPRNFGPDY